MATTISRVKRDAAKAADFVVDDDIEDIINEHAGIHVLAVAHIYDIAASKSAERGRLTIGRYSEHFDRQSNFFSLEADKWRRKYSAAGFIGGTSKADKKAREQDSDRVGIKFQVDKLSNPSTGD